MTQRPSSSFSIRRFLRQTRGVLWAGLVLSCLASLANFGLLFLSGWLLAGAAAAGIGGIVTQNLFNIGLPATGVRFFATVRIVARYAERLVTHDAALRVTGALRVWSFQTLAPRSESLATHARSGDVLTRFVRDTEQLGQFPLDVWLPTGTALIGSIVAIGVTSTFSPASGMALAIGLTLGGVLLPWLIGALTDRLSKAERDSTTQLHNDVLETVQGMADILCCGGEQRRLTHMLNQQERLNRLTFSQALRANSVRYLLPLLSMVCVLAVLAYAARALQAGALTTPEVPMLAMGALAAFEMVAPLMDARLAYERFRQASERAASLCALPIATAEPTAEPALPATTDLQLSDVSVHKEGRTVLDRVTLSLPAGQRCAITGPSGAGKTTLVRLVARLIDPDHGHITLGQQPLTAWTTETLAQQIGVLTQTPHLFQGSVRRNLLMANPSATETQMLDVLTTVHLREDVDAMEDGIDTLCGEQGVRLSGGQARRLALAQILLRRPAVLVLDEPTESLPPDMGIALMHSLLAALPTSSVLCITHRPEPLAFMDRVLCLENGHLRPQHIPEKGGER